MKLEHVRAEVGSVLLQLAGEDNDRLEQFLLIATGERLNFTCKITLSAGHVIYHVIRRIRE